MNNYSITFNHGTQYISQGGLFKERRETRATFGAHAMTIILGLLFSFVLIGIGWVLTSTPNADRNTLLRKTRFSAYSGEERRAAKRYEPLFYRE
jgi:cytochrome c biogenesis protein CcdA